MSSVETMRSWAITIKCHEDIPLEFKETVAALLPQKCKFPYIVFAPPHKWANYQTTMKLLLLFDDQIVFLENRQCEVVVTRYYFADISYIETGTELLNSWIKVVGEADGAANFSLLEYNSAVSEIFQPVINRIREAVNRFGESDLAYEQSKFKRLQQLSHKFMTYGSLSIHKGEKVHDIIFQAPVGTLQKDSLLRKSYKMITNAHVSILTDQELILIQETKVGQSGGKYGHIWKYLPRARLERTALVMNPSDNMRHLEVSLRKGGDFALIFDPSKEDQLKNLCMATQMCD
jgi:hypothetical protein